MDITEFIAQWTPDRMEATYALDFHTQLKANGFRVVKLRDEGVKDDGSATGVDIYTIEEEL